MSRWWRAYDEAVDDPKLCLLSDKQHRAWFNLCCITSQNGGKLPPIAAVAFKLRMNAPKAKLLVAELSALGLIDMGADGCAPHNWNARQYKSDMADPTAPLRQKAYRERLKNRNTAVTDTVTRAETEQNTETDSEQKDKSPAAAVDDWPPDFGDKFWQAYPRKEEKISAMKKLAALRKTGNVSFADLMAGVQRYCSVNREPQFTKQPTAWLTKGCWTDEIKPGGGNGTRTLNPERRSASSDFFAGMRSVAADLTGDDQPSGPAAEEVPLGRVNIEH